MIMWYLPAAKRALNQVVTSIEREDRPQLDIEENPGLCAEVAIKDDADAFQLDPQLTVLLGKHPVL